MSKILINFTEMQVIQDSLSISITSFSQYLYIFALYIFTYIRYYTL